MTVYDWLQNSKGRISREGLSGLETVFYNLYIGGLRRANKLYPIEGTNVYEDDWDVLIILDACRPDLFAEVDNEYQYINEWEIRNSVAPDSVGWMNNTFIEEYSNEIKSTAYVSGNGFAGKYLNPDDFMTIDVVSDYVWDVSLQTIPPRPITDRAIATYRDQSPQRMIVHYMQPHIPFIRSVEDGYEKIFHELDGGRRNKQKKHSVDVYEFDLLRRGEMEFDVFWNAYTETLRAVLDEVAKLLKNIDANDVVISADHGNAVGEFGIYAHERVPLPAIRKVPWCETSATNTEKYTPTTEREEEISFDLGERLKHLGYMN